ncbi:MAG: hypothetical protein OXR67_07440 [Chloroflexota bacterium]|nr:hypothetical protein [Chloroflexota bacterium]
MAEANNAAGSTTIFCFSCGAVMERAAGFCSNCGTANAHSREYGPGAASPRRTDHIKRRNMWVQVLLFIITLTIYGIYWFHVTLGEMYRANGTEDRRRWLWTILYIIPIAQLFAYWRQSQEYDKFINGKYPGIAIFILWIVFAPVVWFLVQRDLNAASEGRSF